MLKNASCQSLILQHRSIQGVLSTLLYLSINYLTIFFKNWNLTCNTTLDTEGITKLSKQRAEKPEVYSYKQPANEQNQTKKNKRHLKILFWSQEQWQTKFNTIESQITLQFLP